MNPSAAWLLGAVVAALASALLAALARRFGLGDAPDARPSARKRQAMAVPFVGGSALLVAWTVQASCAPAASAAICSITSARRMMTWRRRARALRAPKSSRYWEWLPSCASAVRRSASFALILPSSLSTVPPSPAIETFTSRSGSPRSFSWRARSSAKARRSSLVTTRSLRFLFFSSPARASVQVSITPAEASSGSPVIESSIDVTIQ